MMSNVSRSPRERVRATLNNPDWLNASLRLQKCKDLGFLVQIIVITWELCRNMGHELTTLRSCLVVHSSQSLWLLKRTQETRLEQYLWLWIFPVTAVTPSIPPNGPNLVNNFWNLVNNSCNLVLTQTIVQWKQYQEQQHDNNALNRRMTTVARL